MKTIEPDLLFLLGQATAIMVEPKSSETNATQPVGTGPFKLENWAKARRSPWCAGRVIAMPRRSSSRR